MKRNARTALEVAQDGDVLELGANRSEGPATLLRADDRIKRLYLGGR